MSSGVVWGRIKITAFPSRALSLVARSLRAEAVLPKPVRLEQLEPLVRGQRQGLLDFRAEQVAKRELGDIQIEPAAEQCVVEDTLDSSSREVTSQNKESLGNCRHRKAERLSDSDLVKLICLVDTGNSGPRVRSSWDQDCRSLPAKSSHL